MIYAAKQKRFIPDTTRSGYFPDRDGGMPEDASLDEVDSGSDSSESRGSASDEEIDHGAEEQASAELIGG